MRYIYLLLVLCMFIFHSAIGGRNGRSADSRCAKLRRPRPRQTGDSNGPVLPRSCNNRGFYSGDDAVFNGNQIRRLGRALDMTFNTLNAETDSECVESVQQYLCYYYFPLCDVTTGGINPVCDNSCESLFENDDCSGVLMLASQELRTHNIPTPDELCTRTHQSFVNTTISDECIEIEVPISAVSADNDTIDNDTIDDNINSTIDNTTNDDITNDTTTTNDNDIVNNTTTNNDTTTVSPTTDRNNGGRGGRKNRRCVDLRRQRRLLPQFCNNVEFYDSNDAVFNGSKISELLNALDSIHNILNTEFAGNSECLKSVEQYLCYYYFVLCDTTTGQIMPVCEDTCHLLFDNDDCLDALIVASKQLKLRNIPPPDESCSRTHRHFVNPPPESNCVEIEVPVSEDDITDEDNTDGDGDTNDDANDDNADSVANTDTADDDDSRTTIIIGGAVAIVSALVICFIITTVLVLLVRRRKRKQFQIRIEKFINVEEPKEERYMLTPLHKNSSDNNTALEMMKHSYSSEIDQLLKYVEEKFSDVRLPDGVVTRLELIGKGAFGIVHKGELKNPDGTIKAVAIKSIKSESLDGMKNLIAESAIMKTFHHPNVLPLLGVCIDYDDEDVLKIVMPFMANGDLKTFLKDNRVEPNNTDEYPKDISKDVLLGMCLDIAKGMEYLAERRFVHRDLAARNCMVDEKMTIRVADFGLTKDIYSTEYYRAEKRAILPVKWMSPESLLDGYFDEKSDVWSYGVTCWEIFSLGRLPYPGVDNADVISFLKQGKRLDKPPLCPSMMFEMITTMWHEESSKRPSFAEIVETIQRDSEEASIASETLYTENDENRKNNYIDLLPQ